LSEILAENSSFLQALSNENLDMLIDALSRDESGWVREHLIQILALIFFSWIFPFSFGFACGSNL